MATAIEFNHVSKLYRLGLVSTGTFREDIKRWWITSVQHKEDPYLTIGETNDRGTKGESQFVWALRDIDFKVEQGDVVGIIGKNGAGKSTLLKLLSRITSPTTGDIRARGRIASLLEVGTGFHPEMTGRENIYLNGAILGMTKAEIARKLDEIIDFSGCERYIDTPVKRYSSGMRVRLGFAVAAHLDPDILVVDEVLAVGDAEFQKKAIGKMQDVSQGGGRTVLFVSHNMASVRALCKTGVMLENGTVKFAGEIGDTIDHYLVSSRSQNQNALNDPSIRPGTHEAYISSVTMSFDGNESDTISMGKAAEFTLTIESEEDVHDVFFGLSIWNNLDVLISHVNTRFVHNESFNLHKGTNIVQCVFPSLPIQVGVYHINVAIYHNDRKFIDQIERAFTFSISEDDYYNTGRLPGKSQGLIILENTWKVLK